MEQNQNPNNYTEYDMRMQELGYQTANADLSRANMQSQMIFEEKERGMIHEQLNLDEELDRIEHLLRGHILKDVGKGKKQWVASSDPDMIILTEYGIQLILNTISWYINKNTLLSNYDDKMILMKMRDFSSALNKTIFMEYEKIFKMPTFEECKSVLLARIEKKVNLRKFALELVNQKADEDKIREDYMRQIEARIEKEIEKIRESIMKSKLTRYLLLIREIQDAVHSTYNRAYQGQERKTLREHIQVTEARGSTVPQKTGGIMSWLKGMSA